MFTNQTEYDLYLSNKWNWKMEWCHNRGHPPVDDYGWNRAEEAWEEHCRSLIPSNNAV